MPLQLGKGIDDMLDGRVDQTGMGLDDFPAPHSHPVPGFDFFALQGQKFLERVEIGKPFLGVGGYVLDFTEIQSKLILCGDSVHFNIRPE